MRKAIIIASNADIFCVQETHLLDKYNINIPNYNFIKQCRPIHKNAKRPSGGIGILVKLSVYNVFKVQVIDNSYEGIICLKLEHKVSVFSIIVICCYLPPENSLYGRDCESFFAHIITQIYLNIDADALIILGDFNSRTGNLEDSINLLDQIPERTALNQIVNSPSTSFLEFLKDCKLCMLNGRLNPENNDFTFVSPERYICN